MKTELLNEYIFAGILDKHAQTARRERLDRNENDTLAITIEDYKKGFEALEWIRFQGVNLVKESQQII